MAKPKLNVVLVGAGGNMRGAHVPRILGDKRTKIVGVADPEEDHAKKLVERAGYEIPYFANWQAMLKNIESEGVIISTPHKHHNLQVKRSLEDGRHVLVEKPLVIHSKHANSLIQLASRVECLLMVAYQRHWMPEFIYARELIARGEIGEIKGVVGYVTQNWEGISGWRLDIELAGGGMFMDTGSHLVAAMLWVTGLRPKRVWATQDRSGHKVDINMVCNVSFDGGAIGSLTTVGNAGQHDERLVISGTKGALALHLHQWGVNSMLLNDESVDVPRRIRASSPDAAFFAAIRKGVDSVEPPDFAFQVAQLTEAAYKSANENKPISIRQPAKK
ncbi:MAG: Gfo/Idh/MocA family oxidoreductase [Gammaproteobacteria bacterium]|nr:Gfo/Idh/MocA family oxidoreductase [Gammaproteobacteria bacterium]